ncbi:MAG: ATP-binding cassette domain-containing protein [Oceanobacter sp.]
MNAESGNSPLAIDVRAMTRRFGDFVAVNQLDLKIPKGSIYGFLGPNGCGKSTSIRMLTGLLQPTSGEVRVLGHSLPSEAEALRPKIGYMTQKFSLYQQLTVAENLNFVADIYGLHGKDARVRVAELLKLYSLEEYRKQLAGSLSGGQKQRLALAAATLHKPELLFLDEPTSAVDPENRRDFWEHLFDLCDQGTTILVSTHYMDEAERCHRLAILQRGESRAEGSPRELMENLGAQVFEVEGENLRTIKTGLLTQPEVVSAAQLGARLRVLIKDSLTQPSQWLKGQLPAHQIEQVRPSLEDVFVLSTGKRAGAPEHE